MKYAVIILLTLLVLFFLNKRWKNEKKYQEKTIRDASSIESISYYQDKTTSTNINKNESFIDIEAGEIIVTDENNTLGGGFYDNDESLTVNATLQFDYIDRNDAKTSRSADIRGIGDDGYGTLLIGHCHLRDDTRTFRPDRIKNCMDIKTGEIVDNVMQYLQDRYYFSDEYTSDEIYDNNWAL